MFLDFPLDKTGKGGKPEYLWRRYTKVRPIFRTKMANDLNFGIKGDHPLDVLGSRLPTIARDLGVTGFLLYSMKLETRQMGRPNRDLRGYTHTLDRVCRDGDIYMNPLILEGDHSLKLWKFRT